MCGARFCRYVSLLRQRSTTTTSTTSVVTDDDGPRPAATTKSRDDDSSEGPKENRFTKVSDDEVSTTGSSVVSPAATSADARRPSSFTTVTVMATGDPASSTAAGAVMTVTTTATDEAATVAGTTIGTGRPAVTASWTTEASTVTDVITSVYEAATERQRVRVKNIEHFLVERKKAEPVAAEAAVTTAENAIAVEEQPTTQKSILKGRFGGSAVHPRLGPPRKPVPSRTTETTAAVTTAAERTTTPDTGTGEKKFRSNRYVNKRRYVRPVKNGTDTIPANAIAAGKPSSTVATAETSPPYNRFRSTTIATGTGDDGGPPLTGRRSYSRLRSSTVANTSPSPSPTADPVVHKSRLFKSRRPIATTENGNVRRETTTYGPAVTTAFAADFPTTSVAEETMTTNDDEDRLKTVPTTTTEKPTTTMTTTTTITQQPTTTADGKSRTTSGRHNSRFLKSEQKILYIRILPSADGSRSPNNDFGVANKTTVAVTRNRGRIRAYDSLELNTLNDGLGDDDDRRSTELFRGSETKFRLRQSASAPIGNTAASINTTGTGATTNTSVAAEPWTAEV